MGRARCALLGCALSIIGGCGGEPLPGEFSCSVSRGDLVITEIHANPDGSDGTGEFVELYNALEVPVELAGMVLVTSRNDGTGVSEHRFGAAQIPAGDYFVLGNTPPDAAPPHIDYGYGPTLGSLRNSNARLSLWCNDALIDEVTYTTTRDGRSLELDGGAPPNAETNDDEGLWCVAPQGAAEVFTGNFGTPGGPNDRCSAAPTPMACMDTTAEPVPPPMRGGVRITEWLANPVGPDGELEWVEVQFDQRCNLGGVRLGTAADELRTSPFESCFPVDAGTRIVFGASPGAAPRVDADLGITLGNTGQRSVLVAVGDEVLDRIDYADAEEGLAQQVDSNGELCTVGPDPDTEYATGNFGTPGLANPPCPTVLGPGMCFDQGMPRQIQAPRSDDVRITEWMANPAKADNRNGEWVEVEFLRSADLNGLTWSDLSAKAPAIDGTACLPVDAGAHVVFARSADPNLNGQLPVVDQVLGISLNNVDESISLSVGEVILDSIRYSSSRVGVARQLDRSGFACDAVTPYGDGDLGTPGAPNRVCP